MDIILENRQRHRLCVYTFGYKYNLFKKIN